MARLQPLVFPDRIRKTIIYLITEACSGTFYGRPLGLHLNTILINIAIITTFFFTIPIFVWINLTAGKGALSFRQSFKAHE